MMFFPRSVWLTLGLLVATRSNSLEDEDHLLCAKCSSAQPENSAIDHPAALIYWLKSQGGFISDSVEIRRQDPNDPSSFMGMFASRDIASNETILQVPPHFYLGLKPEQIKTTDHDHDDDSSTKASQLKVYFENACQLTHKLMNETSIWKENPENSHFGPYLAYLETQPMGMLPATYSETGNALLRKLQGSLTKAQRDSIYTPHLVDWIQEHFIDTKCISASEPAQIHAAALTIQRGFDSELIPVWDMVNHHNGKQNVETNSLHSPEGIKVWASQPIQAGDELYSSYNFCHDCYDIGDSWGTPGIYRDFGFVETYPQDWPFLEHGIVFEVVQNEKTGAVQAEFSIYEETGQLWGVPNEDGLNYLRTELARIEKLGLQQELDSADLPPLEHYMIESYHNAFRVALKAGIDATLQEHASRAAHEEL